MNFAADKTRRSAMTPARWRMLGVTVGLLVAVPMAAATSAGPGGIPTAAPAPAVPSMAPAVEMPRVAPVVGTRSVIPATRTPVEPRATIRDVRPPRAVTPLPQSADRIPARRDGAVVAPEDPGPSILPRSVPTRVRVPAIAVDSDLVGLGLQHDGRMEVPPGAFPAGWYTGAPTPGELGPAILAGHVDHGGRVGVFHRLRDLRPGDTVEVTRQDGSTAVFRVTRVEEHPKDAFPTAAVYGDIDHAGLRLITCGGPFDRRARSYQNNIVVFAALDAAAVPAGAGGRG